jgi:hypothetical protein
VRRRRKLRLRQAERGCSRGGLTCKTHLAADRRCRPLGFVIIPGQAADSPRFKQVLAKVKVRGRRGRPRTRPDAVAADKAYSSRANRDHLRKRGIKAAIPEKAGQAAHRKKRGRSGGRPVAHDAQLYKDRNTVEALHQQNQGVAGPGRALRQDPRCLSGRVRTPRCRHLALQPATHLIRTWNRP